MYIQILHMPAVGSLRPSVCQSVCKQKKEWKKRCLSVGSELLNLRRTQLFPAKRTKRVSLFPLAIAYWNSREIGKQLKESQFVRYIRYVLETFQWKSQLFIIFEWITNAKHKSFPRKMTSKYLKDDFLRAIRMFFKKKKHIKFREMHEIFIWINSTVHVIEWLKITSCKCWHVSTV